MRLQHTFGFVVLLAWQGNPIQPAQAPDGEWYLTLGGGAARFEDATFSCSGDFISSQPAANRSAGAILDYLDGTFRLTGFGGAASYQESGVRTDRAFGGVQIAAETRKFGIGSGFSARTEGIGPNGYLRFGAMDAHLLLEVLPPTVLSHVDGVFEISLASGQRGDSSAAVQIGLMMDNYEGNAEFFGETFVPVGRRLAIMLRAQAVPGHRFAEWGLATGARLRLH